MTTPVWIRLYSLPQEFWNQEIFKGISNTLGNFVKTSEIKKRGCYITYARICAYMDLTKSIPTSIRLLYQDNEWVQTLDYEHIPFH